MWVFTSTWLVVSPAALFSPFMVTLWMEAAHLVLANLAIWITKPQLSCWKHCTESPLPRHVSLRLSLKENIGSTVPWIPCAVACRTKRCPNCRTLSFAALSKTTSSDLQAGVRWTATNCDQIIGEREWSLKESIAGCSVVPCEIEFSIRNQAQLADSFFLNILYCNLNCLWFDYNGNFIRSHLISLNSLLALNVLK